MKSKGWIKLIIIITSSLSIFSLWIFTYFLKERVYLDRKLIDNEFMHTVDMLDNNFNEYKNRDSILEDLNRMNEMLHKAKKFEFIEMKVGSCFVVRDSYKADERFAYSNREYNHSDELVSVKSMNISSNVKSFFDISIEKGNFFSEEDYIYTSNNISVILGDSYSDIYKIGDTIDLVLYGDRITAKVKGFLGEGSSVISFNEKVILDEFIIIPIEQFSNDYSMNNNFMHTFKVLLDRNNGVISPMSNRKEVENELNDICEQVGLPYVLSVSYKELYLDNTKGIIVLLIIFISNIVATCILIRNNKSILFKYHLR